MINYLQDQEVNVDLIISSTALRALDTARIIAHGIGYNEDDIRVSNQVYRASADQLYDQFFDLSDNINSLMMVGHNPTFTNFANHFLPEH